MEYWRFVKDGVEVVDSSTDYNDKDWNVDSNCFKYKQYTDFDEKMQAINRHLIEKRNTLDNGIIKRRAFWTWGSAFWNSYTTVNDAL